MLKRRGSYMVEEQNEKNNKRLLCSFRENRKMYDGLQRRPQNSMMEIDDATVRQKSWKEYGEEWRKEKEKEERKEDEEMIEHLPKIVAPVRQQKTIDLIEKQNSSRRQRHLGYLEDIKLILNNVDSKSDGLQKVMRDEIQFHIGDVDDEWRQFYELYSDGYMLSQDNTVIEYMKQRNEGYEVQLGDKIGGCIQKMEQNEQDRHKNIEIVYSKMEKELNDIGFKLDYEIKEYIGEEWKRIEEIMDRRRQEINELKEQKMGELQIIKEKYEQIRGQKIVRYREVQYEQCMVRYRTDMQQDEYRYPVDNQQLLSELDRLLVGFKKDRDRLIGLVDEMEIRLVGKQMIEKVCEKQRDIEGVISECIDGVIKKMKANIENSEEKGMERWNQMVQRLQYLGVHDQKQESIEEMKQMMVQQVEQQQEQLKRVISYVDMFENRGDQVIQGYVGYMSYIAKYVDGLKESLKQKNMDYELKKATYIDENDETIENIQKELQSSKQELMESKDHQILEQNLEKINGIIDRLEQEYREYHQRNIECVEEYPKVIKQTFSGFEQQCMDVLGLGGLDQKEELEKMFMERTVEHCKQLLNKQMEEEEIERQNKKEKPKKVDGKKAQAEYDERLNKLVEEVGVRKVNEIQIEGGNSYVEKQSVKEIVEGIGIGKYNSIQTDQQEQENNIDDNMESSVDGVQFYIMPDQVMDVNDCGLLSDSHNVVFYSCEVMMTRLDGVRMRVFEYIKTHLQQTLKQVGKEGQEMIENSLMIMDDRLKQHYPLKGQIETEIYQIRAGIIRQHKKRYERYIKTNLDKVNEQTIEFNKIVEEVLGMLKEYGEQVKEEETKMAEKQSLAGLKGSMNVVRESGMSFMEKYNIKNQQMKRISNDDLDQILKNDQEFIKNMQSNQYSQSEIDWYQELLKEIEQKVDQQKEDRNTQQKQMEEYILEQHEKKQKEFKDMYESVSEEFSAKNGIGKKYGRPKRLGQERLRLEMNKCETAQQCLNRMLELLGELHKVYMKYKNGNQLEIESSDMQVIMDGLKHMNNNIKLQNKFNLLVRQILMIFRSCLQKYQIHIECLVSKDIPDMNRVNYDFGKFDVQLESNQVDIDQHKQQQELELLGQLYFNKENRKYNEFITEIEKQVILECQKIYNQQPNLQKLLLGNEKIPDYLRIYLQQLKTNSNNFRIQSSRMLRNMVIEFNGEPFVDRFNEMLINYTFIKFDRQLEYQFNKFIDDFQQKIQENENTKKKHQQNLRPNLSHPSNKEYLKELCKQEEERQTNFLAYYNEFNENFEQMMIMFAENYSKEILNNFEFIMMFYDRLVLQEDFIKLPGDEEINKKPENLKKIMIKKQSGKLIDTTSERSIQKSWPGVDLNRFQIKDRKISYNLQQQEEPQAGKKDGKKDQKKEKTQQVVENVQPEGASRDTKSYKTFRQKSTFILRNELFTMFHHNYQSKMDRFKQIYDKIYIEEDQFAFYWNKNVHELGTNK